MFLIINIKKKIADLMNLCLMIKFIILMNILKYWSFTKIGSIIRIN